MAIRLHTKTLSTLPDGVLLPEYNRHELKPGIFHLGIGAFHRAHQAFYTETVLNQLGGDWGIIGCSLRSPTVRDQLVPQDCLYTMMERSGEGNRLQVIGAVVDMMVAPENPETVITAMAQANIRIISLTVTEKGYCHDPATGELNAQHPDVIHDLANLDAPVSAIGFLVAALQKRYSSHQQPVTLLSCDNLPNNGDVLKRVVLAFARNISTSLATWIENSISFPNTMIDRMVPATTEENRAEMESLSQVRDEGLVVCEPFSQWVIEDHFVNGRPAWERAGALLVDDVKIYEKIKLRLLNGSHSLMAYTGYLSGYQYISDVMNNPAFVNMVTRYMTDAGETISVPAGFDLATYKKQLHQRFSNPALQHRTWQIAMDGSQKLPQRLLAPLREQQKTSGSIEVICLAVAAWIRYVSGIDEQGNAIEVVDPLADTLRELCRAQNSDREAMVRAVVSAERIFGTDLLQSDIFITKTTEWLSRFYQQGVRHTIEEFYGA